MKIDEVKTAFKIADVEFVEGSTRLNFNYLKERLIFIVMCDSTFRKYLPKS